MFKRYLEITVLCLGVLISSCAHREARKSLNKEVQIVHLLTTHQVMVTTTKSHPTKTAIMRPSSFLRQRF